MDQRIEKEILKRELDQVEDPMLLETIRKILEYGRSKKIATYELTEQEYVDSIMDSTKSLAYETKITLEEGMEYFRKKNP